uniref:Uncharacterized protein n=1 Tax=Strongyloides papillosus TaxID=174720 RepID=A0A0N5BLG4_STREA
MLKRCGKRREVIQGLLISYYFTGMYFGSVLEKIQAYNSYWFNVIEDRFNISKISFDRAYVNKLKASLDDISEEIMKNKVIRKKQEKLIKVEIQRDSILQSFIRQLIKILKISEKSYELSMSKFWFSLKDDTDEEPTVEVITKVDSINKTKCNPEPPTTNNEVIVEECGKLLNDALDVITLVDDIVSNIGDNNFIAENLNEPPINVIKYFTDYLKLNVYLIEKVLFSTTKIVY